MGILVIVIGAMIIASAILSWVMWGDGEEKALISFLAFVACDIGVIVLVFGFGLLLGAAGCTP